MRHSQGYRGVIVLMRHRLIRQWCTRASVLAFVLAGAALPSVANAAPDWTSAQQITQLIVDDSYTTVILPAVDNPMGCGVPTYLRVGKADSNYESMTAAILSAQAQGKKVRLFAAACLADNSVRFQGVWIQP